MAQTHQRYDLSGNKIVMDSAAIGNEYLAAGTSRTLTSADYGRTITFASLTGSTVTLPAATGSGKGFRFVVNTLATGGSFIVKVANTNDSMQGSVIIANTNATGANATLTFAASAGTSDTITLNRTTTGSVTKGEWFEVEDVASTIWQVRGVTTSSTAAATVFSATV